MITALHLFALVAAAVANNSTAHQTLQDFRPKGASYIMAQKPRCKFRYDEKLETRALFILQRELSSDGARFYDAKHPIVTVCRSKAELMFSGLLEPDGRSLLDPPHIFVDVDICSHRVLGVDRDNGTTVTDTRPCE